MNDSRYSSVNTTNMSITVTGDFVNTIITPVPQQNVTRAANLTIRINVTDECILPLNVTAQINYTQGSTNFVCSPVINESSTGYYNCTFNTTNPYVLSAGFWNITAGTNRTYYNSLTNVTVNAFFIQTMPANRSTANVTPSLGGWGETFRFRINLTDDDLDNVNVTLLEKAQ